MVKRKPKQKQPRQAFWKEDWFPPELRSIAGHIGKAADNMSHNDWVNLLTYGATAVLSYDALAPKVHHATYLVWAPEEIIESKIGPFFDAMVTFSFPTPHVSNFIHLTQAEYIQLTLTAPPAIVTLIKGPYWEGEIQTVISHRKDARTMRLSDEQQKGYVDKGWNVERLYDVPDSTDKEYSLGQWPDALLGPIALKLATTMGGTPPVSQMAGLAVLAGLGLVEAGDWSGMISTATGGLLGTRYVMTADGRKLTVLK